MELRKSAIKLPKILPKLVVFDLDETLWPWGVDDYYFRPPYRKQTKNGREVVVDSRGKIMEPFPDTEIILEKLYANNVDVAAASRTTYPDGAHSLLDLFNWRKYFQHLEIYPGCKVAHFSSLKKKTGEKYENMLFFDNEQRNIVDVSKLGVTAILVDTDTGCRVEDLNRGLKIFADQVKK